MAEMYQSALAGLLTFPAGKVDSDMFVLALPLESGSNVFTIIAFVGGLSAATAMVIVESVALSIMVSNDLIMPLVLQRREALISGRENVGSLLLTVRRLAIFTILLLAYVYYRAAGEANGVTASAEEAPGVDPDDEAQAAVTAITQAGHVVVAAAGNDGGPVDAPANCIGALSVAGLDRKSVV